MKFRTTHKRKAPAVIIVSLIDVLMVVLIFLVITTTFKDRLPVNNVPIVRNPDGSLAVLGDHLLVTIRDKAPYLRLNNKLVTIHQLSDKFKERQHQDANTTIVIKANKLAPYGQVVSVRDKARSAGIKKIYEVRQLPGDR